MTAKQQPDFDAIVVGAGFAGLGLIHYLREAGRTVKVFDKASDVGGTWTWNRYPGAATDSEGYYYCLTFSKELLQEWSWSQRYPGWEETHRYLRFLADRCDMWPHIQLNTEISSAIYQKDQGHWLVITADGDEYTCKYFISAMGMISQPYVPAIEGIDVFKGPIFHSSRWPEDLDYTGKRVGIIGAGATTVQMVPVMAETAANVTVFQRTPNYIMPAVQKPMTPEWEKEIKDNYDEIIAKCRNHSFGMAFDSPVGRLAAETPAKEREAIFEELWQVGGFRFCFETFDDLLANPAANQMAADFITAKIREKVKDGGAIDTTGLPAVRQAAATGSRFLRSLQPRQCAAGRCQGPRADCRNHRNGRAYEREPLRIRHHCTGNGFPGLHRCTGSIGDSRPERHDPGRQVGIGVHVHHGRLRRGLPQPVHDHGTPGALRQPADVH